MLLAHMSDTHISSSGDDRKNNEAKIISLKSCINDINSLAVKPDAVIHTGDLTHNGALDEFELVKCLLDELTMPYFITPGNKDEGNGLIDVFGSDLCSLSTETPFIYAADIQTVKLVSLDTTCHGNNLGLLNFDKMAALDKILLDDIETPTLLFAHHPPFNVPANEEGQFEYNNDKSIKLFSEIVDRHPQIVALFCGHVHKPYKKDFGRFDASVAPPTCGLLHYSSNTHQPEYKSVYHLHHFDDGYNYTTEVRRILG